MTVATEIAQPVTEGPMLINGMPVTATERYLIECIQSLTESHNQILALLEKVEGQIGPVIQSMSSGPIGKLMGL